MKQLPSRAEFLVAHGYAAPGRGRPTKETEAFMQKHYDAGQRFSDWPRVEKVVPSKVRKGKTKTIYVKPEAPIVDAAAPVYGPNTKIYRKDNGKEVKTAGLSDVCQNSHFSLSHCICTFYGMEHRAIIDSSGATLLRLVDPDEGE